MKYFLLLACLLTLAGASGCQQAELMHRAEEPNRTDVSFIGYGVVR